MVSPTWRQDDGVPMVDYSQQRPDGRKGMHIETINIEHFRDFLEQSKPYDFDIMLEIKDKEQSAIKAAGAASGDHRFT